MLDTIICEAYAICVGNLRDYIGTFDDDVQKIILKDVPFGNNYHISKYFNINQIIISIINYH
jgi:hypothetical protein